MTYGFGVLLIPPAIEQAVSWVVSLRFDPAMQGVESLDLAQAHENTFVETASARTDSDQRPLKKARLGAKKNSPPSSLTKLGNAKGFEPDFPHSRGQL